MTGKNDEASRCLTKAIELDSENYRAIKLKSILDKGEKAEPDEAKAVPDPSGLPSGESEAPESP
jgi:hypothetical protein